MVNKGRFIIVITIFLGVLLLFSLYIVDMDEVSGVNIELEETEVGTTKVNDDLSMAKQLQGDDVLCAEVHESSINEDSIKEASSNEWNQSQEETNQYKDETYQVKDIDDGTIERTPAEVESYALEVEPIFTVLEIDEDLQSFMMNKSYQDNDYISYADLRLLEITYYGYDDYYHKGQIIVNKLIADKCLEVFKILYREQFPIESIRIIDYFGGDDNASMVANNSSSFNYREMTGQNSLSLHAYGLAIDINPLVNPFVTASNIYPQEGAAYADRSIDEKGMISKGDICYNAFISQGFTWGGDWNNSKDYQHFEFKLNDDL